MRFIEIINNKKYTLISIFLFLYVIVNLFEGDRGITSYYKNKQIKKHLIEEGKILNNKLALVEKKNILLTEKIDLDYLEILYRSKFMLGKPEEKIIQLEK